MSITRLYVNVYSHMSITRLYVNVYCGERHGESEWIEHQRVRDGSTVYVVLCPIHRTTQGTTVINAHNHTSNEQRPPGVTPHNTTFPNGGAHIT